jgi:hypothetical protein
MFLSLIVGALYIMKTWTPQWPNLTWREKYIYPLIAITVTFLFMNIGAILAFAYNSTSQVTYERLVGASKLGTGCSSFLWFGFVISYFMSVRTAHARARGQAPRIGIKRRK